MPSDQKTPEPPAEDSSSSDGHDRSMGSRAPTHEDLSAKLVRRNRQLAQSRREVSRLGKALEERDAELSALRDALMVLRTHNAELTFELEKRSHQYHVAMEKVRRLRGMLSICMHCHRIEGESHGWERLDSYMTRNSNIRFSHGICPTCMDTHYPDSD